MRMELTIDAGPDGPELGAYCDGVRVGPVTLTADGYRVGRDSVPPEFESAVRELEDAASRSVGRVLFAVDVRRPTPHEVMSARARARFAPDGAA